MCILTIPLLDTLGQFILFDLAFSWIISSDAIVPKLQACVSSEGSEYPVVLERSCQPRSVAYPHMI